MCQTRTNIKAKPDWLKVKARFGEDYRDVKKLIKELNLHTVCQEATCPNIGECYSARTATFIILGDICTRSCRFCDVRKGKPEYYDLDEPNRVAQACEKLKMRFSVITSVTRDDLNDGGASIFANTTKQIKSESPGCGVELLIPDLMGNLKALAKIIESEPNVLSHNLETVPRLYTSVRPKAEYKRSLDILKNTSQLNKNIIVKSGIMIGLGESEDEIVKVIDDAVENGCQIFTIGQYLQPSKNHLPIQKFYSPEEFKKLKEIGEQRGMKYIESGPLVRSSYMAHNQVKAFKNMI